MSQRSDICYYFFISYYISFFAFPFEYLTVSTTKIAPFSRAFANHDKKDDDDENQVEQLRRSREEEEGEEVDEEGRPHYKLG